MCTSDTDCRHYMNYLCERHVCWNSDTLFGQKSLLLLREHNIFELELKKRNTSQIHIHLNTLVQ